MRSRLDTVARRRGFTLIELLVVIAVIGILASISITNFLKARDRVRQRTSLAFMRGVASALSDYSTDVEGYPVSASIGGTDDAVMLGLLEGELNTTLGNSRFNPWGFSYHYETDAWGTTYTLQCYGKNGLPDPFVTHATRFQFELDQALSDGLVIGATDLDR